MFNLKRINFVLFSLLLLILVLAGCGSSEDTPKSDAVDANDSPKEENSTLDAIKDRGVLVAGVKYDTALFGYQNPASGEVEGFDADLMKALSESILGEESVEFVQVTSKTRIPLLQNNEVDIVAATLSITEERREQIDFTEPYFIAGQSLLVPKDSHITSVHDLGAGDEVIAVKGAVTGDNLLEVVPDAELLLYEDHAQSFAALQAGKGVALTSDNVILLSLAQEDPNYTLLDELFTDEPYGLGIRKGDDEFLDYVDNWLVEIQENGIYDELHGKWFNE